MKKALFAVLFVVCMLSSFVFADVIFPGENPRNRAPSDADLRTAPIISKLEIHNDNGNNVWLEVTVQTPDNVKNAIDYFENHELGYNQAGYIGNIVLQYSIDGGEWEESSLGYSPNYEQDDDNWNGIFETEYLSELHVDSNVRARAYFKGATATGIDRVSDPSNELVLNEKTDFQAHDWAKEELAEADKLGLIPDILKGQDLTRNITRQEFAHVAVKLWEKLSGSSMAPGPKDPFTDTHDPEVLKAYNLEITKGTSETTFMPNKLITREEMATMMARTLSKAKIDTSIDLNKTTKFDDDNEMHDWGKTAIYYMSDKDIIKGIGENKFGVAGNATREQALLIAVRSVNNVK